MRINLEPKLMDFSPYIHILIPKRKILRQLNQIKISDAERIKLLRTLREIEKRINQLEHCRSLVDKCLMKVG